MPTFKRKIANALERLTGTKIVSPANLGELIGAEHIRRLLTDFKIDCVFDVGANAGQFVQILREAGKYSGPVVSFEPVPHLAQGLRIAAEPCSNWHIREVALDRSVRRARFMVTQDAQFSSLQNISRLGQSMFPSHVEVSNEIEIVTSTLAREFPQWQKRIGFCRPLLKIDTQGNDLAVAQGAGELLKEFAAVQVEVAIQKLYDGGSELAEVMAFFRAQGFEPSAFTPNNEGSFPLLLEIDCMFINRKYVCGEMSPQTEGLCKASRAEALQ